MRCSKAFVVVIVVGITLGLAGGSPRPAAAQGDIIPLRVEVAVTGELTAAAPAALYSFQVYESLRMGVVFDVITGDMQPSLVVLDQDQQTVLAGVTGPNANGLILTFPVEGQYYLGLSAEAGTSATYRLMIDADPPQPVNTFVLASYMVAGKSTQCLENTPATRFTPNADLNVCFAIDQIEEPVVLNVQWWSPSGEIVMEEGDTFDSSYNGMLLLSGLVYSGTPFETGWWQVHYQINGELAFIQWLPVIQQ